MSRHGFQSLDRVDVDDPLSSSVVTKDGRERKKKGSKSNGDGTIVVQYENGSFPSKWIDKKKNDGVEEDEDVSVSENASVLSNISTFSNLSMLSEKYTHAKESVASTLADALQILQGINPVHEEEEEDEEEDDSDDDSNKGDNEEFATGVTDNERPRRLLLLKKLGQSSILCRSQHQLDQINSFISDKPKDMTFSRRVALYLMKKYRWYNPRLGNENDEEDNQKATELLTQQLQLSDDFRSVDGYPNMRSIHEIPSLEIAWAYFDHVTLPRYLIQNKRAEKAKKHITHRAYRKAFAKSNKTFDMADPGETVQPTKLYPTFWIPHKQLGDWGLSVGLYFTTLRCMIMMMFICFVINIPNLIYFSGSEYSGGQVDLPLEKVSYKGSAVCTQTEWVPCIDCNDSRDVTKNLKHIGIAYNKEMQANLTFVQKNNCDAPTELMAMVNLATIVFIILGMIIMGRYLDYMEVKFDEDEQTAQDYSIIIENPPPDATDAEEWKQFFKENFDASVACCTIALNNDLLVRSLQERREKMKLLETLVPPGTSLDMVTLARIAAKTEGDRTFLDTFSSLLSPGIPETLARISVLTSKVRGLAQCNYPVSKVFITFESENDQRYVLSKLTVSKYQAYKQQLSAVSDSKYLFRGNHLLKVEESGEPSEIRWEYLNATPFRLVMEQMCTTTILFISIYFNFIVVNALHQENSILGICAISVSNSVIPYFAKFLVYYESHANEGKRQTSLYFKMSLFRWLNTGVLTFYLIPFTSTLDYSQDMGEEGTVPQVQKLFFSELVFSVTIQFGDFYDNFRRHVLAPRALTQDAMNLNMTGTDIELAERYTNMTKIIILAILFSSLYPWGFFYCGCILTIYYILDKFSLTRQWKRAPKYSSQISKFDRKYFLAFTIIFVGVYQSYFLSGYPFDNVCEITSPNPDVKSKYIGNNWNVTILKKKKGSGNFFSLNMEEYMEKYITSGESSRIINDVAVTEFDSLYQYCNQDFFFVRGKSRYPFIPQWVEDTDAQWMTDKQASICFVFSMISILLVTAVLAMEFFSLFKVGKEYFVAKYRPVGDSRGQSFSTVPSINIYIPRVKSNIYSYSLLATNVDQIHQRFFESTDPLRDHAFYDLTKDADKLVRNIDLSTRQVFSKVHYWPPPSEKNETKEA